MKGMAKSMETLGGYLVLVFFAAQFVAFFKWTNLGLIFAVKGAEMLRGLRPRRHPAAARLHPAGGVHQPRHGQRLGEVGADGAGLRADVDAARLSAGADPGGLPRRRQRHQRDLADDELLRADHRVRAALRQEGRHRHAGGADVAVLGRAVARLGGSARRLDVVRPAARPRLTAGNRLAKVQTT